MKRIITLFVVIICSLTCVSMRAGSITTAKVMESNALLCNSSLVSYNNPDKKTFPAGLISWDEYGLYFTSHKQSKLETDDEFEKTLVMDDLIVNIQMLDRLQYSDTQLGDEVINTLASFDVCIAKAHGGEFNKNPYGICGGYAYGNGTYEDDDAVVLVCCLLDKDTTCAFMITMVGINEQTVLKTVQTLGISTPQEKKVR